MAMIEEPTQPRTMQLPREQMKNIIIQLWDSYSNKYELAKHVMEGYIFGVYANNEHYNIDDIVEICLEVDREKNEQ